MTDFVAPARFLELRDELSRTLAQTRKWPELPRLLDELDRARRRHGDRGGHPHREALWVDRFAQTLLEGGASALPAEQLRRAARRLWPWMGDYDPVALARGHWDALPRSYA